MTRQINEIQRKEDGLYIGFYQLAINKSNMFLSPEDRQKRLDEFQKSYDENIADEGLRK